MNKKISLLALAICLLLTLFSPVLAQAQETITILDSHAQVEFPTRLSFSLSAQSDVDIVDIRLCYVIDRAGFADVTSEAYVRFVPGTKVDVDWTLDMIRIGGLPPGSNVKYWWTVKNAAGNGAETPPSALQFNDNRHQWRSITEDKITIHWYEGNETFAAELMTTAQQALNILAADTGAQLVKPAGIYIYASTQDLVGALIYPQEWTGGVAFTRFGIISIGISPANLAWGKRAMTHELAHLVVHQMTLNPYIDLPTWLDEGLAMYAEGLPGPEFTSRLHQAVIGDTLISVRSLSSPFSANADEAILSYAESQSLVEFLIGTYGQTKMLELLNTFSQGSGYDEALNKVYGFDMDGLDAAWRDYVSAKYRVATARNEAEPILAGILPAPAGLLSGLKPAFKYGI
ncbi:peptidase MA family metallohydrolase [Chloroflexota bacterium]